MPMKQSNVFGRNIESARYKDPWPKSWLNVENLILFDQSISVYKILNKLCPESFWNMFQLRSSFPKSIENHDDYYDSCSFRH